VKIELSRHLATDDATLALWELSRTAYAIQCVLSF